MDTQAFLFESWTSLARTFVVGVLAYVTLFTLLRVVGKHSLAKLNAYGLVITVALGSMLASALLTKQVTLADGIAAIGLLLALQFLFSTVVSRSAWAAQYLTARPMLLLWHGRLLEDQIRREGSRSRRSAPPSARAGRRSSKRWPQSSSRPMDP